MQHRTSAPSTETPAPQGPRTRAELDALVGQRTELRDQLREMGRRRNQIEEQIQSADPARLSQIRGEMKEIDSRATAINTTISVLDDKIAAAIGRGVFAEPSLLGQPSKEAPSSTIHPPDFPWVDTRLFLVSLAGEALAFVLVGVVAWRFGVRRLRAQLSGMLAHQSHQLQQVQQSIDVIAVEVERISEGQRFVAKTMADKALAEGEPAS